MPKTTFHPKNYTVYIFHDRYRHEVARDSAMLKIISADAIPPNDPFFLQLRREKKALIRRLTTLDKILNTRKRKLKNY